MQAETNDDSQIRSLIMTPKENGIVPPFLCAHNWETFLGRELHSEEEDISVSNNFCVAAAAVDSKIDKNRNTVNEKCFAKGMTIDRIPAAICPFGTDLIYLRAQPFGTGEEFFCSYFCCYSRPKAVCVAFTLTSLFMVSRHNRHRKAGAITIERAC